MKIKQFIISVLFTFSLIIFLTNSQAATVSDISGSYTGDFTIELSECTNNKTYSYNTSSKDIVMSQTGDSFSGIINDSYYLKGTSFSGLIDSLNLTTSGTYQYVQEPNTLAISSFGNFTGTILPATNSGSFLMNGSYSSALINHATCVAKTNGVVKKTISCTAPEIYDSATNTCITPPALVCTPPQVPNATGTSCITPPLECTPPQVPNATGTSCITPTVTCTLPQVPNATGTSCITPSPTCTLPQVLDSTGTSCITPTQTTTCTDSQVLDSTINKCVATPEQVAKVNQQIVKNKIEVQQAIQIARSTNTTIIQHLSNQISGIFPYKPITPYRPNENKDGASADQVKDLSNSFWGSSSITDIHQDNSSTPKFSTQIYQFVGGVDKRLGDFFVGSALTYAYSDTAQSGQNSSSHIIGITPYAAYHINDFVFISALASYNFTRISDKFSLIGDTDVHDYTAEANLNLFKIFYDAVIVKGRLGMRFHHNDMVAVSKIFDASTDELVGLGDIELGYRFNNGFITYTGFSYEHYNREQSFQSPKFHQGVGYIRGGVDYPVYDNLMVGAKIQADINDNQNDLLSGSLSFRLAF